MNDIVIELREYEAQDMAASNAATIEGLMKRAADEIERLRALAGGVSKGQSFGEIKREIAQR